MSAPALDSVAAIDHGGQTGVGSGWRGVGSRRTGGGGGRLEYADDAAVDLPGPEIILTHPSFPRRDEAPSIAGRRAGVRIDLPGRSPRYLPRTLARHGRAPLKREALSGSGHPTALDRPGFDEPAHAPIHSENAAELLGLTPGAAR